jgi:hypothetical protein
VCFPTCRFAHKGIPMLAWPTARPLRSEAIEKIPTDWVGRVTQDFCDSDAEEVKALLAGDGTWTVIATFRE